MWNFHYGLLCAHQWHYECIPVCRSPSALLYWPKLILRALWASFPIQGASCLVGGLAHSVYVPTLLAWLRHPALSPCWAGHCPVPTLPPPKLLDPHPLQVALLLATPTLNYFHNLVLLSRGERYFLFWEPRNLERTLLFFLICKFNLIICWGASGGLMSKESGSD